MFDIDKYEPQLQREQPAAPHEVYAPASNVEEMSLLFWGEHCVECAAPACYKTCDLYQARPDKRCRRFAYGAFKNSNFVSLRGYGVEISFKKWAKIEAFGNLSLYPVKSVLTFEKMIQWGAPVANAVGKVLGRLTSDDNWDSVTYIGLEKLSRYISQDHSDRLPEAFLLEVYNPSSETVRIQLGFSPYKDESEAKDLFQLGPSFVTTLDFPSGYSRYEIEASRFQYVVTSGKPFKIWMVPEGDKNARLVFLTADFVTLTKAPVSTATQPSKIKCVVWDLDNTLWKGILVEGDDVALRQEIIPLLKHLDERGILLSIASKNDHASAWQKLEQLGISDYFLYPQINWTPKSAGIKAIAEQLNIGIDTFAFIDDNPFELEEVGRTIPSVLCLNATEIPTLFSDSRFQGSTSAESRHRRQFYKEAIDREKAQADFGDNFTGFLASCGIILEIAPYSVGDDERVAELVQRTNQLNFSGHKYTRQELNDVLANPQLRKYVLKSSDKYGSYGTVGFGVVEQGPELIQIRDFMLSCRVQGKFIEQAFFSHLLEHHNPDGAKILWVNFHETARNKPAQYVLESLGFRKCSPTTDVFPEGVLHSSLDSLKCAFIEVHCSASTSDSLKTSIQLLDTSTPPQLSQV